MGQSCIAINNVTQIYGNKKSHHCQEYKILKKSKKKYGKRHIKKFLKFSF